MPISITLYGLKQTPQAWFAKFNTAIQQLDFRSTSYDTIIFISNTNHGYILLLFYVDDMIITGNDVVRISTLKTSLQQHFEIKDLGYLNYFLDFEVLFYSDGYYFS